MRRETIRQQLLGYRTFTSHVVGRALLTASRATSRSCRTDRIAPWKNNAVTALQLAGDKSRAWAVGAGRAGRPGGQGRSPPPRPRLDLVLDGDLRQGVPAGPPAAQGAGVRARVLVRRAARRSVPPPSPAIRTTHGHAVRFGHGGVAGRAVAERQQRARAAGAHREGHDALRSRDRALSRHISSLATIGATAPFVGLFGTVWGIMNSFQSIALTKNTTLAVVAPASPKRCSRPRSAWSRRSRR